MLPPRKQACCPRPLGFAMPKRWQKPMGPCWWSPSWLCSCVWAASMSRRNLFSSNNTCLPWPSSCLPLALARATCCWSLRQPPSSPISAPSASSATGIAFGRTNAALTSRLIRGIRVTIGTNTAKSSERSCCKWLLAPTRATAHRLQQAMCHLHSRARRLTHRYPPQHPTQMQREVVELEDLASTTAVPVQSNRPLRDLSSLLAKCSITSGGTRSSTSRSPSTASR